MMKDKRPRPLMLVILICLVGFVVFLAFPEPLAAEISMEPQWYMHFSNPVISDQADPSTAYAFRSKGHFGYFYSDASFLRLNSLQGGAALSDSAWLSWNAGDTSGPVLISREGQTLAALPAGHVPFFHDSSLFSLSPDFLELQRYDESGKFLWSYVLPAHVSAFDHGSSLTAVGMLDGSIEVIDANGRHALRFLPGGSRLEAIFGLAVSDDGMYLACLSGLDPQRLVVLGKGEGGYRVVSHRYLETSFRTPSSVAILEADPYVLYRDAGGIGVSALDGSFSGLLPADAETFTVHRAHHHGLYYIVARQGASAELLSFKPPARLLGRTALPEGAVFVRMDGDTLYFATDQGLARISVGER